jgi:hypothetical protein
MQQTGVCVWHMAKGGASAGRREVEQLRKGAAQSQGGQWGQALEQHRKGWHQNFDSNTLIHVLLQKVGEEERAAKRACSVAIVGWCHEQP